MCLFLFTFLLFRNFVRYNLFVVVCKALSYKRLFIAQLYRLPTLLRHHLGIFFIFYHGYHCFKSAFASFTTMIIPFSLSLINLLELFYIYPKRSLNKGKQALYCFSQTTRNASFRYSYPVKPQGTFHVKTLF